MTVSYRLLVRRRFFMKKKSKEAPKLFFGTEPGITETITFKVNDELENLTSFESIFCAMVFRIDGILVEASIKPTNEIYLLETIHWIKNIISKVGAELRFQLYRIAYSRETEHIYFYKVGNVAILACILGKMANLGLLAIEMDRIASKIKDIIDC